MNILRVAGHWVGVAAAFVDGGHGRGDDRRAAAAVSSGYVISGVVGGCSGHDWVYGGGATLVRFWGPPTLMVF